MESEHRRRSYQTVRRQGVKFDMLPCQTGCPGHREGCHKDCARWKEFQAQQQLQRQKKKDYLKFYNDLCSTVARQCIALGYSVG